MVLTCRYVEGKELVIEIGVGFLQDEERLEIRTEIGKDDTVSQ